MLYVEVANVELRIRFNPVKGAECRTHERWYIDTVCSPIACYTCPMCRDVLRSIDVIQLFAERRNKTNTPLHYNKLLLLLLFFNSKIFCLSLFVQMSRCGELTGVYQDKKDSQDLDYLSSAQSITRDFWNSYSCLLN